MFSSILKKLKKPKILKSVFASVAQIVIIILLLPFLSVIIKLIMPEKITDFITLTLGEIPIIDSLTEFFTSFSEAEKISSFSLFAYTIEAITSSIVGMYIIGTFVHIFIKIGEFIGIRGIPALQTVAGIFCSCLCLKFIGDNLKIQLVTVLILMIIDFVLTVIVQKGQFAKFLSDVILGIGFATITSGTVCAYCTVLVLIIKGWFSSFWSAANVLIWAFIPAFICLFIDYLLFSKKD